MRKKILMIASLTAIIVTLFYACKKERSVAVTKASYKAHIIPIELAKKLASRIPSNYFALNNNGQQKTSDDFPILDRTIDDYYTVNDENDSAALYVFNYANDSGYIVISAEVWHQPICAYVDIGKVEEYDSVPGMLIEWFGKTVDNIQLLRDLTETDTSTGKAAWRYLLDQTDLNDYAEQVGINFKDPGGGDDCDDDWSNTTVGPLLPCTWGQGCSYNESCPNLSCSICYGAGNAWTGCVATSMSQVIRYWTPTTSFNYNYASMPNTYGNSEVQRLMADAGESVSMSYGCGGSAALGSSVPNALTNNFGFATATRSSYGSSSYLTVVSNLNNSRPVFLEGCASSRRVWLFWWKYSNCHEWICDGYNKFSNSCYSYLYFHMNWGWHELNTNNDYNGWFLFNNWTVAGQNFHYSTNYVYNVHT